MDKKYLIKGMGCAACSNRIERGINGLEGVEGVRVNLLTNSMMVSFDERIISSKSIIKEVESLGYEAEEESSMLSLQKGENDEKGQKLRDYDKTEGELKRRFIVSLIFEIPLFLISMIHGAEKLFPSASWYVMFQIFLLIPIVIINYKFYKSGIPMLLKGSPNMDSLIAVGTIASIPLGYFDSVGMILTLVTLGKWLESGAKKKTTEAIRGLMNLTPDKITVIRDGEELLVQSGSVRVGEIIKVKPGESIGVDGVIVKGETSINQAAVTGESIPVDKTVGEKVIGGTLNIDGAIQVRATEVGKDTVISKVAKLVEEAASGKAPISRIADRVSGVFVPAVIAVAIVTIAVWLLVTWKNSGVPDVTHALVCGISVLVISCPCALGLATPVAIMVGTGRCARDGIIIKSAEALENLGKVDTVIFDKTGTITKGELSVTDVLTTGTITKKEVIQIAASIEANSEHPLARAICNEAKYIKSIILPTEKFKYTFGKGIESSFPQNPTKLYYIGNEKYIRDSISDGSSVDQVIESIDRFQRQGKTTVLLADQCTCLGLIALADEPKDNSAQAVIMINKMGKGTVLLTGDNRVTAEAMARQVGTRQVFAEVLPADKEMVVRNYQNNCKTVAMVGDGINDAPAISRADVGIAIGTGTNIAIDAADMILMNDDLLQVEKAIILSNATLRTIKTGLFWAFFYNVICIPIAAGVLYPSFDILLNPMIAAGAMSLSSLCVVLNALRLKKLKIEQ